MMAEHCRETASRYDCASYIQYNIEIHATKKLRDERVLLKNYGLKQILTQTCRQLECARKSC